MRIPRIYHPDSLQESAIVTLSDNAVRHVITVLRLNLGAKVIFFDGHGGEYHAELIAISKKQVQAKIFKHNQIDLESPLKIHLGYGMARGEKIDFVIQKAVELGVDIITPLFTERCGVKLTEERSEKRLQHWQAIMISACEQCGRNVLPRLNAPIELSKWLSQCSDKTRLVLNHRAVKSFQNIKISGQSLTLLIGPEGGLTEDEVKCAESFQFSSVSLGPRVLRTETAAIAAIAAAQCCWGDF